MASISRITLVDPDFYEPANLAVQNIDRTDVGRPKVEAQAEKLRRIRPSLGASGLDVIALQDRIEESPSRAAHERPDRELFRQPFIPPARE